MTYTLKLLPVHDFSESLEPGVRGVVPEIPVPQVPELAVWKKPEPFGDLLFDVPIHSRGVLEKTSLSTPLWMFLLQDLNTAPLQFCRKCVKTQETVKSRKIGKPKKIE